MRRRVISVLLVFLFLLAPVFADVAWSENKVLGNAPHYEIGAPNLSLLTKGNVERSSLPYPASLEVIVEYAENAMHPLRYNLYLYENPHAATPATLAGQNVSIDIMDGFGECISFSEKRGTPANRITLSELHALGLTKVLMDTGHAYIRIDDGKSTYTFELKTGRLPRKLSSMMYKEGATDAEVLTSTKSADTVAFYVAREMKHVATTSAPLEELQSLIELFMENSTPEFQAECADVLWSYLYDEWLEYFGTGYTDKADAVLYFMAIEPNKAPDETLIGGEVAEIEEEPVHVEEIPVVEEEAPVVEEEPVVEEPVVEEKNEIEIDDIVNVDLKEDKLINRHVFISAKTYGMGVNVVYAEEGNKVDFPLGGALDFAFFGGHHGVSLEAAYVYDNEQHQIEPGISYLYKMQKSNKAEIDFRLGFITNIQQYPSNVYGFAFGGRAGLEMNFFVGKNFFFNMGMHVRGLSPVYLAYDGFNKTSNTWYRLAI